MQNNFRISRGPLAAALLLALFAAPSDAGWEETPTSLNARSDARLADVCFIDTRHGWAVGDRGAIWATDDGGLHWTPQTSGVGCRLTSVHFLDGQTGWAVGGWTEPYTHVSRGVVLRTSDGGRSWQVLPKLLLPAMTRVRFFDRQNGIGIGETSALFPSGVFATQDGGRTWSPLSSKEQGAWHAGDFTDLQNGALAGRHGAVATVQQRTIRAQPQLGAGVRGFAALRLVGGGQGWLVGQGGLAMTTRDGGRTWREPDGALPDGAGEVDFADVSQVEQNIWIVGAPGSQVLHSADDGESWRWLSTGQPLPLHAVQFVDRKRGWAVGALGTILHTADGGETWRVQRAGGKRAALLALVDQPRSVSPELLARESAGEGRFSVVQTIARDDLETPDAVAPFLLRHQHEALIAAGASEVATAWQFPIRQQGLQLPPRQIIQLWDAMTDGHGLDALERRLVLAIRTWRPEIVVTHPASPRGDDPLGHILNQLALRAVDAAGDPTRYSEQITQLDLSPWKVRKALAQTKNGAQGEIIINGSQWSPLLGMSLADYTLAARGLLQERTARQPEQFGFQIVLDRVPQGAGRRDLFSGILLQPGGDARREQTEAPPLPTNVLSRLADQRRQVQALVDQADDDPRGGAAWIGQMQRLTQTMPELSAGQTLSQLAHGRLRAGHEELASDAFHLLAERYPNHPLSGAAVEWIVQHYASGEAAHRARREGRLVGERAVRTVSATPADLGIDAPLTKEETADEAANVDLPSSSEAHNGEWLRAAAAWGAQLERTRPQLYAEPPLRFPLAVALRKQGRTAEAERFYTSLQHARPQDAWRDCAAAEAWLRKPEGVCPKPIWMCHRAEQKPRLDGKLDDPLWVGRKPIALRSPLADDEAFPAEAWIAYDDEYLYLAIRCRNPLHPPMSAPAPARKRDDDLTPHDRVELLLDIDRDYATWYRLAVDSRGCTAEACVGDTAWNPTWYVARHADGDTWTVEIAIPLEELTADKLRSRTAWAVGLQRTAPGVGFQAWQHPASERVTPEGFGLLLFE